MLARHELSDRGVRLVFVTGAGAEASSPPSPPLGRGDGSDSGLAGKGSTVDTHAVRVVLWIHMQ
jgi:hypothetical protein